MTVPLPAEAAADDLSCLNARRSVPARQLQAPGPDDATLERMLRAAVRVPDHGKRMPWRFLRIAGNARLALGEALVARALQHDPGAGGAMIDKDRQRFAHAPLVIAVVAKLGADGKIPESERFSSASCVCFALLQAAQACGFGAQWLTGWPAYDAAVAARLGLAANEHVLGFLHLGTASQTAPERERPDAMSLLSELAP